MNNITKEQFVTVLDDARVTQQQRDALHRSFERRFPEAHQAFLQWLGFTPQQVQRIRAESRS